MGKGFKKPRRHSTCDVELDRNSSELLPIVIDGLENRNDYPQPDLSPFNISLILYEIFADLRLSDLKNCRKVCSHWNEIGVKVLSSRNKGEVIFRNFPYRDGVELHNVLPRIKEFAAVMDLSLKIPYHNYEFDDVSFRNPAMKIFFQKCGLSVKHLSISISSYNRTYLDSQTFTKLLTELTPNLESLEIKMLPRALLEANSFRFPAGHLQTELLLSKLQTLIFPDYHNNGYFKPCKLGLMWEHLLIAAPNLKTVESRMSYHHFSDNTPYTYQREFLKALKDSRRMTGLTKLRFRHLQSTDFHLLHAGALEQGMVLVEFTVEEVAQDSSTTYMDLFLESQSKSLKVLSIGHSFRDLPFFNFTFPKMENLTTLSLIPEWNEAIVIGNSDLSVALPKLISLNISAFNLSSLIYSSSSQTIHVGVKNLSINFDDYSRHDIEHLGIMFPKIETLKLGNVESGVLSRVWKTWPNLRELEISLSCLSNNKPNCVWDEQFATYSDGMKEMLTQLNQNLNTPHSIKQLLSPSILDMEQLQSLKIQSSNCYNRDNSQLLTDTTGIFLFSNMIRLRILTLEKSRISKQCEQYIRAMLPKLEVFENLTVD